jgi:hypothetical protein
VKPALCVADASALHEMSRAVDNANHPNLLTGLTRCVDQERLAFPREVADELQVVAREEPIWAWANGLTSKLDKYSADIALMRPLMGHVRKAGFPHGIESLDGKEGCLTQVGCLCLELEDALTTFVLATEDTGEHPLRPTMEQIAVQAGWSVLDARGALTHLGLEHLLN